MMRLRNCGPAVCFPLQAQRRKPLAKSTGAVGKRVRWHRKGLRALAWSLLGGTRNADDLFRTHIEALELCIIYWPIGGDTEPASHPHRVRV
jgi:hypothetical protein